MSEVEVVDLQTSRGILECHTIRILDGFQETWRTTPSCVYAFLWLVMMKRMHAISKTE